MTEHNLVLWSTKPYRDAHGYDAVDLKIEHTDGTTTAYSDISAYGVAEGHVVVYTQGQPHRHLPIVIGGVRAVIPVPISARTEERPSLFIAGGKEDDNEENE